MWSNCQMMKEDIEKLIRGYIRENVIEQPTCFPANYIDTITVGKAAAFGYWDHRTNNEINRDKQAGVASEDYVKWVIDEIISLKKLPLHN